MEINRALIVRAPYARKIVMGLKSLEMRSSKTNIRELIGIIEAGTGKIIGEVVLDGWTKYTDADLQSGRLDKMHRVEDKALLKKWNVGWHLKYPMEYAVPVEYNHPKGAVIWVKL